MSIGMEVIPPHPPTQMGEKSSSSGKKRQVVILPKAALSTSTKNIGPHGALDDRKVTHFNAGGQIFCGKALSDGKTQERSEQVD